MDRDLYTAKAAGDTAKVAELCKEIMEMVELNLKKIANLMKELGTLEEMRAEAVKKREQGGEDRANQMKARADLVEKMLQLEADLKEVLARVSTERTAARLKIMEKKMARFC